MFKRAALGGAGPMLNPLFGEAVRHYLEGFTTAFANFSGPKLRAIYHDSHEYSTDWSPDLLAEFERLYPGHELHGDDGGYLHGSCPFHQDDKPSFWVDAAANIWGCFASGCQQSGAHDVINLYAAAHGLSVDDAIARMIAEIQNA